MFIGSFPAGPWQANCYLVAPQRGEDVVVVDPGVGAAETLARITAQEGFGVAGVLLTHGHIDHVANAADVADAHGVRCWLHEADRELLTDIGPIAGPSLDLARELGVDLREPQQLELLAGGETVEIGPLAFEVIHAPGHRPGCVLYRLAGTEVVFTGDVLFAGSIGRTDLPGGDHDTMLGTLRDVVLALPDEASILSGHGPESTMAAERATNPYLQPSYLR